MRLVDFAHETLKKYIQEGDHVIDATVGNGHDTCFLAKQVGNTGLVYGFDLQKMALEVTTIVLKTKKLFEHCQLLNQGHETIEKIIPTTDENSISCVMYNLGYLPHGDKGIITLPETTLSSLNQALKYLKKGGVLSILAYRGHKGGQEEFEAVQQWLNQQKQLQQVITQNSDHPTNKGPYFWLYQKQI